MAVHEFDHHQPTVADTAFIAPSAELIGQVTISEQACVLFNAVLRGDTEEIFVGEGSNIQDGVVVHAVGPAVLRRRGLAVAHAGYGWSRSRVARWTAFAAAVLRVVTVASGASSRSL